MIREEGPPQEVFLQSRITSHYFGHNHPNVPASSKE
jgi:hypothetical protein